MRLVFQFSLAAIGLLLLSTYYFFPAENAGEQTLLGASATAVAKERAVGNQTNDPPTDENEEDSETLPSMLDDPIWESGGTDMTPVPIEEAEGLQIGFYADTGLYLDDQGRYVVDLLEQDYAYLTVLVTDNEGRSVTGATPEFAMAGSSRLVLPNEVGLRETTDDSGTLDFAVIGGEMNLDEISVTVGESEGKLAVNVISLRASGFPQPKVIEGGLPWSELMSAKIGYTETGMTVEFPDSVASRTGEVVRLSGFIMPLDPSITQSHFLLTSNPPSCFFHIPGGPAGAVEVYAPEGIEATFDPVVVEGHFEAVSNDEYGVIYKMQDARIVEH